MVVMSDAIGRGCALLTQSKPADRREGHFILSIESERAAMRKGEPIQPRVL
jgi:hypothetical protein